MTAAAPRHIAIVMDGNRRWARAHHLPVIAGHRQGVETIRRETPTLVQDGVRLRIIGRLQELSDGVRRAIDEAGHATDAGKNGTMTIAFNYGGRAEIVDAVKRLVADGVPAEQVDEAAIARRLYAPEHPDPDLLIRTGGELRVSNFLLWEVAYAEMWATDVLWPDFAPEHLDQALASYARRERRYGR